MAAQSVSTTHRGWLPWPRVSDFEDHLRDDADVHRQASLKSDEILAGIDAANLSITALSTKLGPLLPITDDLGQIVGRRRFRHDIYRASAKAARGLKKTAGYGGTVVVGLAAIAAVYAPANDLLQWLLTKLTFGAVSARVPAIIQQTPTIPGITH